MISTRYHWKLNTTKDGYDLKVSTREYVVGECYGMVESTTETGSKICENNP